MVQEELPSDEMKQSLMNRYRETLIRNLTRQDLAELQTYLKGQYDPGKGWNHKNRLKFESKLRQYFHEEIIRREISSIEAVLKLLTLEDLKN
jgi:hypothetical protein